MQLIPNDILTQFEAVLKKRSVPVSRHADYRKWLRYYLDFRGKYSIPDSKSDHVRLFIEKLRNKDQTPEQQKQAAHALSLFFESQLQKIYNETPPVKINTEKTVTATTPSTPRNRVVPTCGQTVVRLRASSLRMREIAGEEFQFRRRNPYCPWKGQ